MSECKLYNEDCFDVFPLIEDNSVDMILCDLPYGTTACKWDSILPLDKLWEQYKRIIKPNGAIVLTAQQPFTTKLISSNYEMYKYNWIWQKDNAANFLNSHLQPLKVTEDICVFSRCNTSNYQGIKMTYNAQMRMGFKPYVCSSGKQKDDTAVIRSGKARGGQYKSSSNGERFPINLIKFNRDKDKLHPTQKPVALMEYLIRTYTNEGDLVLDNCMGSGTTGVACKNLGRNFIGIEKERKYFEIAERRIKNAVEQGELF